MGLDVTAYSKLEYVGRHEPLDLAEMEEDGGTNCRWTKDGDRFHIQAFAYDSFPHALAGLPTGAIQQEDEFITGGCFAIGEDNKAEWLAAGSYSGYGRFRDMLRACFADDSRSMREQPDAPFFELVWFADNEGTLLTQACTDLLADFKAGREQWVGFINETVPSLQDSSYYVRKYDEWTAALELAADGGLLDFH